VILWHLRRFGVPVEVARTYLATKPTQTLSALRRAYFLQLHRAGHDGGREVRDWAAWLRAAIGSEWAFDDSDYRGWLDATASAAIGQDPVPQGRKPDDRAEGDPTWNDIVETLGPGIHPILVAGPTQNRGTLLLRVHLVESGTSFGVGGFRAELGYDPQALAFVEGTTPPGMVGAWESAEPGRVFFAGAAARKSSGLLAEMRFTVVDPAVPDGFRLRFLHLATEGDFQDLTAQLVIPQPLLVLRQPPDAAIHLFP
jgi:hypothetical protein